jgi:hypothetical protein
MNIVKGVADLIRRTSGGQTGEPASESQPQRFSPPGPKICFRYLKSTCVVLLFTFVIFDFFFFNYIRLFLD